MSNTNDRPYNAFLRLAVQLCDLRETLRECSEVSAPEFDPGYVVEQVSEQIDTLEFMARDVEKYWGEIQHDIAKAAGSLNLDRPDDDLSWCHAIMNTAWTAWNKLSRQCQKDPADRIRAYAMLADTLHSFEERNVWKNRIAKEFRGMAASSKPRKNQRKSYASGTPKKNSGKNNHTWDANAKRMATRYIAACKKAGKRLNRPDFIKEELDCNAEDFPNSREASTLNQSLKIHSAKWKVRLDKALGKTTDDD